MDSFSETQLELITVKVIRFIRELSPNIGLARNVVLEENLTHESALTSHKIILYDVL